MSGRGKGGKGLGKGGSRPEEEKSDQREDDRHKTDLPAKRGPGTAEGYKHDRLLNDPASVAFAKSAILTDPYNEAFDSPHRRKWTKDMAWYRQARNSDGKPTGYGWRILCRPSVVLVPISTSKDSESTYGTYDKKTGLVYIVSGAARIRQARPDSILDIELDRDWSTRNENPREYVRLLAATPVDAPLYIFSDWCRQTFVLMLGTQGVKIDYRISTSLRSSLVVDVHLDSTIGSQFSGEDFKELNAEEISAVLPYLENALLPFIRKFNTTSERLVAAGSSLDRLVHLGEFGYKCCGVPLSQISTIATEKKALLETIARKMYKTQDKGKHGELRWLEKTVGSVIGDQDPVQTIYIFKGKKCVEVIGNGDNYYSEWFWTLTGVRRDKKISGLLAEGYVEQPIEQAVCSEPGVVSLLKTLLLDVEPNRSTVGFGNIMGDEDESDEDDGKTSYHFGKNDERPMWPAQANFFGGKGAVKIMCDVGRELEQILKREKAKPTSADN
eukprot:TRINITY_DN1951_c0_g2_i1.p1 TRINITY_DN1951_c0_g2~~TRINITY_DN1951_c0_g2_i1.p1  ORF type:complete len:499 (-),score=55.51 TRINITY_DN1951_c0_g2_i1:918-2414(-)